MSEIDPDILSALKEEDRYVASTKRFTQRVKLNRGDTWKIRFLPAKLGPRKVWYARWARHWNDAKSVTCPIHTGKDFGGDPDAYCPVCDLSNELNNSSIKEVSSLGYNVRSTSQWITYCIVLEKNDAETAPNDLLVPYEFPHYVSTWEELRGYFKASYSEKNKLSVLDYMHGNVFSVMRAGNRTRLDKLDRCPIFDPEDENFKKHIAKLEASIKLPKITVATQEQLEAFAAKLEEDASRLMGRGSSPKRRAAPPVDDIEDEDEGESEPVEEDVAPAPARRPAAAAAARPAKPVTRKPAPPVEEEEEEADEIPGLEPTEEVEETAPEESEEGETDAIEEEPVAPVKRKPAPAAAVPVRKTSAPVAAQNKKLRPMPEAAESPDEGSEDEQLPEEDNDPAPAADLDEDAPEEVAAPPPPVSRKGASAPRLGDAMKERMKQVAARDKAGR